MEAPSDAGKKTIHRKTESVGERIAQPRISRWRDSICLFLNTSARERFSIFSLMFTLSKRPNAFNSFVNSVSYSPLSPASFMGSLKESRYCTSRAFVLIENEDFSDFLLTHWTLIKLTNLGLFKGLSSLPLRDSP